MYCTALGPRCCLNKLSKNTLIVLGSLYSRAFLFNVDLDGIMPDVHEFNMQLCSTRTQLTPKLIIKSKIMRCFPREHFSSCNQLQPGKQSLLPNLGPKPAGTNNKRSRIPNARFYRKTVSELSRIEFWCGLVVAH